MKLQSDTIKIQAVLRLQYPTCSLNTGLTELSRCSLDTGCIEAAAPPACTPGYLKQKERDRITEYLMKCG
jgi:hypothetical protein